MQDIVSLLSLPTQTLVVMAGGYIGYRISAVGKDTRHTTVDVVFNTLVFGLICRTCSEAAMAVQLHPWLGAAMGMFGACVAAMVWRRYLEATWAKALKTLGVSISDRHLTAWDPLRVNPALRPSQITVHLQSGDVLMCDNVPHFANRPTGPCSFGIDGSVALYVTQRFPKGASEWIECDVTAPDDWGCQISYIPADQIERIDVRY